MGLIPVFLISLERTPERYDVMRRQFDTARVPFTWIKAIDGQRLSEQELRRIMPRPNSLLLRFPLTAGQIASTASHRHAIELIRESGADFGCVMEDDGKFDATFAEFLDRDWLATLPTFDALKLACDWASRGDDLAVPISGRGARQICVPLHPSYSARCYILSRNGAGQALRRRPATRMRFLDVRPIVVGVTDAKTTQRSYGRDAPAPWWRPILSWMPHRLVLWDRKVRRYLAFVRALGPSGFRRLQVLPLRTRR